MDLEGLKNVDLVGGFNIVEIELTDELLIDPLGREAAARTRINGTEFTIIIRRGLSDRELSVTLYHEILESATMASLAPPTTVTDLNEAGFERAAQQTFDRLGEATIVNLNSMLQSFGFRGE